MNLKVIKNIALCCFPCFLLACTTLPVTDEQDSQLEKSTQQTKPKEKVVSARELKSESNDSSERLIAVPHVDHATQAPVAVIVLLQRAAQQTSSGNSLAAQASLERAIRIAPRHPESYYRLGEWHYQQGNDSQARALAQKALSLGAQGPLKQQVIALLARINVR